ncbi:MAG: hypothetical protein C4K60_14390 [Ideonella sp. MAG2]|nr:MAG: hypothetical protein C4K60_14390 [Ideonella sp. MAG2]
MYLIQETPLNLPEPLQDRSVNVLSYVEPSTQAPFQIVINRDVLIGEETIPQCFDRQLNMLARQAKHFKVLRRETTPRADGLQPLYTVESSFSQAGRTHHQLQCMLLTSTAPHILVLTLSTGVPPNDGHRQFWNELLSTLDPAQPTKAS